jgi:beta-galactosidase
MISAFCRSATQTPKLARPTLFFREGCYKKELQIPEEWWGQEILLEFEGVYMNAEIRVNGQLIMRHIYGYTSFFCDITPYVRYGEANFISVNVNNDAVPNSRWYSGSGIYRHVWLEVRDPLHIASWGVSVTTPAVSTERSVAQVRTTLENHRHGGER